MLWRSAMTQGTQGTIWHLTWTTPGPLEASLLRLYKFLTYGIFCSLPQGKNGAGWQDKDRCGRRWYSEKGMDVEGAERLVPRGERRGYDHTGAPIVTTSLCSSTQDTLLRRNRSSQHMWPQQPHETHRLLSSSSPPCPRLPRLSFHSRPAFTGLPKPPVEEHCDSSKHIPRPKRWPNRGKRVTGSLRLSQSHRLMEAVRRLVAGRTRNQGIKDYDGKERKGTRREVRWDRHTHASDYPKKKKSAMRVINQAYQSLDELSWFRHATSSSQP